MKKLAKGFIFKIEWMDILASLEEKDIYGANRGRIGIVLKAIKSLHEYGYTVEDLRLELNKEEKEVYDFIAKDVITQRNIFVERCNKSAESAKKRWEREKNEN